MHTAVPLWPFSELLSFHLGCSLLDISGLLQCLDAYPTSGTLHMLFLLLKRFPHSFPWLAPSHLLGLGSGSPPARHPP